MIERFILLKIMKRKSCKNIDLINSEISRNSSETIVGELNILKEMYREGNLSKEEFSKAKKKF